MKKGKLYTVTPWNKQALAKAEPLPAKNLFDGVNMPTQQMNNNRSGIGNFSGQQSTFGMNNTNFGAAGNPYTPGTTAFNHYNIQSVENSISNGSYFNRNKDAFTYKPQNYVKGIDFTTDYNDTSQRWNSIVNSAAEGIGGWKPNVDTSGIPTQETSMAENPGWSTNPYLKAGMSIASQVKTGDRRGVFDTLDPFHNLAGNKKTKAGQVLGDVGVALTSTGIPYAMLAGAALKVVGDFADLGWGYSVENEQEVKDNIAHLKNVNVVDGDLDSIQKQYAQAGIADIDVGDVKNGWFNNKGDEESEKLTNQQDYYKTYAEHMFTNAANNYKQDQLFNALKQWSLPGSRPNQTAYGGLLDMKDNNIFDMGGGFNDDMPITNFGFVSDYLTTKRKQAEQKNVLGNMFAGAPNSMFAIGGDLQTNGSDWSTGLTHVDAGQSHEMNPYDGVQMGVDSQGVPNLVEEGEVIFNDYVYSQRITLDNDAKEKLHFPKKQDITYADAAKKLEREIKERPNDPISQAGFEAQMGDLAEEQERQKAEMEAAKAQEAFDSLSDEEKVAVMQQAAQQEQMAQEQAMQEQAMAEQTAAQQQPTPEEMAMMEQQQQTMQGVPTADAMGTVAKAQPVMACGGKMNKFDKGGMKQKIYNLLKLKTKSDWDAWVKKNGLDGLNDFEDWDNALQNTELINAIAKDNPALRHALENKYDFGLYKPSTSGSVTFDDDRGNWDAQTVQGWWGSTDPAWQEVIKNNPKLTKDTKLSKEELANLIRSTDAFKKGTQWLQDSEDNRLNYLKRIINNPGAPDRAVAYARKFIDENGWKEGAARDYETIFNNPSGRAANPGTYWKTPIEAVRNSLANNYVINEDGTVEALEGGLDGLKLDSTYQWADPQTDYINNYYRRAAADNANGQNRTAGNNGNNNPAAGTGDDREVVPIHRNENWRYAGLLAPAVGLGMQALGIGKPDASGIMAAANAASGPAHLATPHVIGDYMRYKPIDRLFEGNRILASSRATDRNLMNTSGGNRGTAMAGLLANGYNTQIALGNADMQAENVNWGRYGQTKDFNRGTNQFNAQALNQNSQFNADALNRQRQYAAQMQMQAAAQKADMDAAWYNGIYGNVAGLFKGIGDAGRENAQHNTVADMIASGIFGTMKKQPIANGFVEVVPKKSQAAKGGKIKRKKNKRGLTF